MSSYAVVGHAPPIVDVRKKVEKALTLYGFAHIYELSDEIIPGSCFSDYYAWRGGNGKGVTVVTSQTPRPREWTVGETKARGNYSLIAAVFDIPQDAQKEFYRALQEGLSGAFFQVYGDKAKKIWQRHQKQRRSHMRQA